MRYKRKPKQREENFYMKKLFAILALALLVPVISAKAGELDNENQIKNAKRFAADLPQTLVVKKDVATGAVSVLHSATLLEAGAPVQLDDSKFIPMKATDSMKQELDKDSSASGWYYYWYNYSYAYPTYYYYGFNYYYQPYYNYYWGGCNYYWYRWFY